MSVKSWFCQSAEDELWLIQKQSIIMHVASLLGSQYAALPCRAVPHCAKIEMGFYPRDTAMQHRAMGQCDIRVVNLA